jgi:P4 family phage/plasmid primase-like protien
VEAPGLQGEGTRDGEPLSFYVGDSAEVAGQLVRDLNDDAGEPIASDLGELWRYREASGLWEQVAKAELINRLRRYSGARLFRGNDKDGEPKWGSLRIQGTEAALGFAMAMPLDWDRGAGFFADAPRGLAFADCFLEVVFRGQKGQLVKRSKGPEHRAKVGYDFPMTLKPEAPAFFKYLRDIWGHHEDHALRVALLQEFVGAALLGLGTRYHRALLLQGAAGAGKSTFLNILAGLFPTGSVAHVKPSYFEDDNKLAALVGKRLNVVYEIGQDRIVGQDIFKEVLEGAGQTVVEKYKIAYEFFPEAAHAYGCNDWPSVPGAHASFWDRWLCMQLDIRIRGTEMEERELATRIIAEDLPGIVAWALEGAERLLKQDRFSEPPSSRLALAAWRGEADAVAIWATTACSQSAAEWWKASALFERFIEWARKNHFTPCSSKTFGSRLRELGVESKTSNGVHYFIAPLPSEGPSTAQEVLK